MRVPALLMLLCVAVAAAPRQSTPERVVFGRWRVTGSRCPTQCAIDATAARSWLGRQVVYGDSVMRAGEVVCHDPRYRVAYWPSNGRYGGARLSDFGIGADSAMVVEVGCPSQMRRGPGDPPWWPVWGAFAVVKDSDHVFVISESRWFALTRL